MGGALGTIKVAPAKEKARGVRTSFARVEPEVYYDGERLIRSG
jgi:hypothetical protein